MNEHDGRCVTGDQPLFKTTERDEAALKARIEDLEGELMETRQEVLKLLSQNVRGECVALALAVSGHTENEAGDLVPQETWDSLFAANLLEIRRSITDDADVFATAAGLARLRELMATPECLCHCGADAIGSDDEGRSTGVPTGTARRCFPPLHFLKCGRGVR